MERVGQNSYSIPAKALEEIVLSNRQWRLSQRNRPKIDEFVEIDPIDILNRIHFVLTTLFTEINVDKTKEGKSKNDDKTIEH